MVQSPERSSARAWFWIRVGQFVEEAFRAWNRVSWILGGVSSLSRAGEMESGGEWRMAGYWEFEIGGEGRRKYLVTCPSRNKMVFI